MSAPAAAATDSNAPLPPANDVAAAHAPWVLGFSGGGFRAMAGGAAFALALMNTQVPGQSGAMSLWQRFARCYGVSGGGWNVAALYTGVLSDMATGWTLADLLTRLVRDDGCIRAGDFDARTVRIHEQLMPHLGEVMEDWSPACGLCPDMCSCLQCLSSCLSKIFCCCCDEDQKYPLSAAINERTGEVAFAAMDDRPIEAMGEIIKSAIFAGASAPEITFNGAGPARRRAAAGYSPEGWLCALTEGHAEHQYWWCTYRVGGGGDRAADGGAGTAPALEVINPPPGHVHVAEAQVARALSMSHVCAFVGSAFAFDARAAEEAVLGKLILAHFPFSPCAVLGHDLIAQVPLVRYPNNLPPNAPMRDGGIDCNLPFAPFGDSQVAFAVDNGAGSTMGAELAVAQKRGTLGKYVQVRYDADHNWGVYRKCASSAPTGDSSERGPEIIVYVMGINDPATMNVRVVQERVDDLRRCYDTWIGPHGLAEMLRCVEELLTLPAPGRPCCDCCSGSCFCSKCCGIV